MVTTECVCARIDAGEALGCSKIWDLEDAAVGVDEDVVALDVTVYDLVVMLQIAITQL